MSVRKKYTNKAKTRFCWEFVVDIPSGEFDLKGNPIRKQKRVSGFEKEKEAKAAERKFLEALESGNIVITDKSTFSQLANNFLNFIEKSSDYQKGTVSNYKGYYNNHMKIFHNMIAFRINDEIIENWILDEEKNGTSSFVINGCRKFGMAVFTYHKKKIRINPFADMKKRPEPKKLRNRLSLNKLLEMIDICQKNLEDFYCIFCLATFTGMRLGEYSAVTVEKINTERNEIYVNEQFTRGELKSRTKTENSTRIVKYPEKLNAVIKWHRKKFGIFSGLLFKGKKGKPISQKTINRRFKDLLSLCNLPEDYMRVHDLRGEYTDLMHSAGVPVPLISRNLGHSSTKITNDIYTSILNEVEDSAMKKLNDML